MRNYIDKIIQEEAEKAWEKINKEMQPAGVNPHAYVLGYKDCFHRNKRQEGSFVKVNALVTDHGDMSVGINPCFWVVECPFYRDESKETQEYFREQLKAVYSEFAEGKITVDFDYEPMD